METEAKTASGGKRIGAIVGGLFLFLAVLGGSAYWFYSVHAVDRDPKTFSTKVQWVLWGMGMKQAYVSDTYGGDTPEETLNLYISALEAGDVSLASKYYIPEMWKEKERKLLAGSENGALPKLINLYKSRLPGVYSGEKEYFSHVEQNEFSFDFQLVKNEYTNKWKIAEP